MIRPSFRQSMLSGFLLITLLLSAAGVRSWLLLEEFVARSRADGELALQLSASIQELAERTLEIERSARQFTVLNDPAFLDRFDEQTRHSLAALQRAATLAPEPVSGFAEEWRQVAHALAGELRSGKPHDALPNLLNRLSVLNAALEQHGRQWIDARHSALLAELDRGRLWLGALIAGAVAGALAVALLVGGWLSRPIKAIEQTIARLGESRFDAPVAVGGPADLQQVGQRLDWLRQRLRDLEADRDRTLRHVSHELKTPLTALREGIALLQEGIAGPLEGTQREVVDILNDNARALHGRIDSLLRLNAVLLGSRQAQRQPVNLQRLLDGVVQARELQIQARQLAVDITAPASSSLLDSEKLRVVLDNLLSNAIDFSPEGGRIRLSAAPAGDAVRIACIDEGPGIAAEDAERIFAPFTQGRRPPPEPRQGSGVGLSIVRELLAVMGGTIRVVNAGQTAGAHFEIVLPISPPPAENSTPP